MPGKMIPAIGSGDFTSTSTATVEVKLFGSRLLTSAVPSTATLNTISMIFQRARRMEKN